MMEDNQMQEQLNPSLLSIAAAIKALSIIQNNPYKAKAHAASNQSIADVTATKVVFGTEDYDTNNNFASNTYTAPITGYYQVNCTVRITTSKGVSYTLDMRKNGSSINLVLHSPYPAATLYGDVPLVISDLILLSAGDTIDFYATCDTSDSSAANVVGAATSQSWVSIYLVSTS